ncbi:MAG: tetratricopeptide repeat protein [Acidobacteriota bacterium]
MLNRFASPFRAGLLSLALGLCVVSVGAQGRNGGAALGDLAHQVRIALGHGDLATAKAIAAAPQANASLRELSLALIDMFEGRDAEARTRLTPLATAAPLGEASLELGLLDMRTGRRDEAQRRLYALASVRTLTTPDDYFRLARAARATREFLLANDAYKRVDSAPRADIQSEWGDLFFERHLPGDAVTNYKKALELDPRWVPALVGLARALDDEDPEEASKAVDAAREQAPDFPALWALVAEQTLDKDNVAEATQAVDRLAQVKPGSLEEAGLRARLAYKNGGMAAVEAAAVRGREIDPTSAQAYRLASEQAGHQYRFDDAAALARKATALDPNDALAQFDLGLHLLRTGDEAAARTALEASWELDKSAPVTKNLLELLDHLEAFEVVPHNDFIFKFSKEEAPVLRAYALPLADEAYRQYSARYGITPKGPILVEVFPRHDDFAVRTLGLPGLLGALGACFGRVVTMDSPRARPPGEFSWQATLWHEMAHVFTLQLSDYRVPRWLTEGISGYEEHRRQAAWGHELTLQYAQALAEGKTFGVKRLPEAFKSSQSISLGYFEAALVVEHLVALHGEAGLRTLLQAYANGASEENAFMKAYGQDTDAIEASFKTFIETRYGALRDAMRKPPSEVAATDLDGLRARATAAPGNFVSQVSLGQALERAGDLEGARAPLERAAALAPQAQGDGSPHGLLAAIAEKDGDTTRARREWRALLLYDHTNVGAARKLAAVSAAAKAVEDETYALRLIADLDPFDADTHGRLGKRLMEKNDYAAALIEFQAAVALGPANLAEAHADVSEVLLKLGRLDDAKREALSALKEAPSYDRAQDLLLAATGR